MPSEVVRIPAADPSPRVATPQRPNWQQRDSSNQREPG